MKQKESAWWHDLVVCPSCGSSVLQWPEHLNEDGECGKCGRAFKLRSNVLYWREAKQVAKMVLGPFVLRILRSFLHPISSRLLPFRYLTHFRLERYYRRTLVDLNLARKWTGHYLKGLNLPNGATVLDFGCGRGRVTAMLSKLGYRVVGEDRKAHTWWHKISGVGFQEVESGTLPLRDASFDLVVEIEVIHYIDGPQLLRHIQEIRRILKPGGYWLLHEGNSRSYGARELRRQIGRLHELDQVKKLVAQNGFLEIDQSFDSFYAPHFPLTINFIRKFCTLRQFDFLDYDSWLVKKTEPERRGRWLMRLKRSDK